jgi:predicted nucleic acid-binding protein
MPIVVDASIVAVWVMRDETAALADAALESVVEGGAVVPAIFWFEVRNLLVMNERRNRLAAEDSAALIEQLDGLRMELDRTPDSEVTLRLARRHRLTVYDAAYLELAGRRGLRLATLDRRLAAAAAEEGLALLAR